MRHRFPLLLIAALFATAPSLTFAQSFAACQNGEAGGYACDTIDLYAHFSTDDLDAEDGNDIWGWTDPETSREYALVGLDNGTAFVDVTDPNAPVYLGKLPTATNPSSWRDIKTYADHAFIVSEASGHGMQVFDLTRLRSVENPPVVFAADTRYTGFGSAHNLVINEDSGFAFGVGAFSCNGGLHMVDIRDPLHPTEAGCFSEDGYTHDAQCVIYDGPDTDYTGREICMASNEDTVTIVDVTDKAAPELVSLAFYPNAAYTHQGWFTEDKRYFIVNDELDEIFGATTNTRTIIFDMEDLDNPEFYMFYFGATQSSDHNLYVRGNYVYESNYRSGLRILDISHLDDGVITEVAYFDTYPASDDTGTNGQWSNYPFFPSGTIVANDIRNGLFILKSNLLPTAAEPVTPGAAGYTLSAPTPNPTSGRATLRLAVAEPQHVTAEAFDVAGRRVATLFDGAARAGATLTLTLDGTDLPSGLYLVRVTGEQFSTAQRVSLVR